MKITSLLLLAGIALFTSVTASAQTKAKAPLVKKEMYAKAWGYKKANGVEYKAIRDMPGKNAEIGDVLELQIVWKVGKDDGKSYDSVIVDTRNLNGGKPTTMQLPASQFRGDMSGGLLLMSAGDSGIIRVLVDTLQANLKGQQLPAFAKSGQYFIYEVSMISVKSREDAQRQAEVNAAIHTIDDDRVLQEYFTRNKLKPAKTASGLYYTIQTQGAGDSIVDGNTVSVMYTGKFLDGTAFDSNIDPKFGNTDPFLVHIGAGGTIPAMDQGLRLLKKGSKATLYVPSPLAYGGQSPSPSIPANSIMVFELEITEVK